MRTRKPASPASNIHSQLRHQDAVMIHGRRMRARLRTPYLRVYMEPPGSGPAPRWVVRQFD